MPPPLVSVQLSQVLGTARTLLNDDAGNIWTDAVLIPKAQEAHRELQTELWLIGSPIVRAQSAAITVPIGAPSLGVLTPADLLVPIYLQEATPGGVDWSPMTEVIYFPLGVAQTTKLIYWSWRNEEIQFLGSTAARWIIIQYRKLITVPTLNTSPIGILFGELYLSARTAALAAGSVGNAEVYGVMTSLAKENFSKVIAANRGQQRPGSKP